MAEMAGKVTNITEQLPPSMHGVKSSQNPQLEVELQYSEPGFSVYELALAIIILLE